MTIGDNIRYYRERQMISQEKLAELSGLASGTISRYELDKVIPKQKNIKSIADALNVTISQLTTIEPNKNAEYLTNEEIVELVVSFCQENNLSIVRNKN